MMTRKDLIIKGSATLLAATPIGQLMAEGGARKPVRGGNNALLAAVSECILSARLCDAHCQRELAEGNKTLAGCARSVEEVIAACGAIASLAASNSKFTKKMAVVCAEICENCRKECEKHAHHHAECKACMESCEACIRELKKIA
jgi:Cys-rich four helix bundle protein (predicted Tat secretion target)